MQIIRAKTTTSLLRHGYTRGYLVKLSIAILMMLVFMFAPLAATEAAGDDVSPWWSRMSAQFEKVWSIAYTTAGKIFSGEALQVAQLGSSNNELVSPTDTVAQRGSSYVPTATSEQGTLVINAPLFIDTNLRISGLATLSTTTILGLLTIDALETNTLTTVGAATFGSYSTLGSATVAGSLVVGGGITTNGADIDLEGGSIFASNIVNTVTAGDNISITGTQNNPVISVDLEDLEVVTSLNGETGELDLEEGEDIEIDGLTIENVSTLDSVRGRGGCSGCILDGDVSNILTILSGTIDDTIIGASTPAAAFFTNVAVGATSTPASLTVFGTLTTVGTATSTFGGGMNITDGCYAVDGVCIAGAAPASYVGLTDTPNTLIAGALQFANATSSALTQSAGFVYRNDRLGIGTSTPTDTLTVVGDSTFTGGFTVINSTSSLFVGGINVTSGCVAVNGTCLTGANTLDELNDVSLSSTTLGDYLQYDGSVWRNVSAAALGLGDGTYLGLSDSPNSFVAGAIQYVNASNTALTQAADFVFTGTRLGIGTSSPMATLSVVGNSAFVGGINVTSGCVAVNGTCLGGADQLGDLTDVTLATTTAGDLLQYDGVAWVNVASAALGYGDGTYLGLDDTPDSFIAGALQFANATSSAITQTASLTYLNNSLRLGTSSVATRLSIDGDASLVGQGTLRLYSNGSNYVGFRASSTLASDTVWTLPTEDGSSDHVLVTDGAGNLRFAPVSAIGGGSETYLGLDDTPNSFTAGAIQYVHGSSTYLTQSSNFVFTGTNLGIGVTAPTEMLEVNGSVNFNGPGGTAGLYYNQSSALLGLGTESPSDRLTILGGSITQQGGNSTTDYGPSSVGGISLSDTVYALDVVGNYAYLVSESTGNDFHVVDVTNPAAPAQVAAINLTGSSEAVVVRGRYAFVGTDTIGNNFHVIDISNPLSPVQVAVAAMPSAVNGIAIAGRYAYVVSDSPGDDMSIVDISDPLNPVIVGGVNLPTNANGVAVRGDYAYVTTNGTGNDFHVINISNPTAPTTTDSVALTDGAHKVVVSGAYAYVTTNGTGNDFHVINVRNPADISVASSVALDAAGRGIALAGRYAYIASLTTGDDIEVVDVANPLAAVRIGGSNLGAGSAYGIRIIGRYAYMTTEVGGNDFHVFDISGATLQSAIVYSISGSQLSISDDATVAGRLRAGVGLSVGAEGIVTDGALLVYGSSSSYIEGSLGIGTTSTSSKLTVDGSIKAANLLGGATNLTTDANGVIIRDPSDTRLKENVTEVENALELLTELRGVRYEWIDKDRFGAQVEIGFIAQEVDLVLPEVVSKGGDYWSLNKSNMIALVVEAVKDLWDIVRGQGERITELEARVQELEAALGTAPTPVEQNEPEPDQPTDESPGESVEPVAPLNGISQEAEDEIGTDAVVEDQTEDTPNDEVVVPSEASTETEPTDEPAVDTETETEASS